MMEKMPAVLVLRSHSAPYCEVGARGKAGISREGSWNIVVAVGFRIEYFSYVINLESTGHEFSAIVPPRE